MPNPLHEGDLEGLWAAGVKAADPRPYIDRLVAVARTPILREADIEPSYPFGLAAAICKEFGWLEEALVLLDEGMAADPTETPAYQLADRAELLIGLGRVDEGMALLESLRPLMGVDITATSSIVDVLTEIGRRELAVEWMTVAVRRLLPGLDELTDGALREFDYLVGTRRRVRQELDLVPDKLDQLERTAPADDELDELEEELAELEEQDRHGPVMLGLMFWPEDQYALVISKWPQLAEGYGGDWDGHRVEFKRIAEEYREQQPIQVAAGDFEGFLRHCEDRDLDSATSPARANYAANLTRIGLGRPYPPERNAPCWCGSGCKYKSCCLNR